MRFGTTMGFSALTLSAAAAQQMSNGEQEYLNSCAVRATDSPGSLPHHQREIARISRAVSTSRIVGWVRGQAPTGAS
ncbi:hypothetical protein [Mesorhizobium sp. B2-7-2]|uniref:hypothetical protein n=1 Tax=Mesorhizobium sp. B2-7-2 TaxID=2589908 RepID=UPI0015E40B6B|nr:hypothetical protein [Mesorhizobium sp. B2-7-2]